MKILCLGDSNTYGYDPRGYLGGRYPVAWPEIIHAKKGWEMINLGENGREIPHTQTGICAIDQQITSWMPADGIIIWLGSNDMMNIRHATVEEVAYRMEQYIIHIREIYPQSDVLLLSPVKIIQLGEEIQQVSEGLGAAYQKIAEKYHLRYADTNDWGIPISFDGVHLTEEGHRLLADHLIEILECV